MRAQLTLPLLAVLASCSSPPPLPTVDDQRRRPVNTTGAIELQRCRADLSAARIALTESLHATAVATATAEARVAQAIQRERETCRAPAKEAAHGNRVYVVPFATGSINLQIAPDDLTRISDVAMASPLVVVRGRSDGADTAPETALARRRAQATADLLVRAGLPRERLRIQWQGGAGPDSDPVAGIGDRRAEIEVYGARPDRIALLNPQP